MKIKKQNKIVPYILMFHFVKNKKNKKGFVWKVEEWEIILVRVYHSFAMGHPKIASAASWYGLHHINIRYAITMVCVVEMFLDDISYNIWDILICGKNCLGFLSL
jgi:hypothetical protein